MEVKNKADLTKKIISFLEKKHSIVIGEDENMSLDDVGEDCMFSLTFELAGLFDVDGWCDGDEIGEHSCIYHAVDAMWDLL